MNKKYKDCKLVKENVFLTDKQTKKIKDELNSNVSKLMLRYKSPCTKSFIYVDSHIVRTLNQTVLLEIQDKKVKSLDIASFMEPREYLAPDAWLKQFLGEENKNIDALTGATLTENAIKRLVKKYRITHKVLNDKI